MKEKWEVVENYFSSYVCDVCVEWVVCIFIISRIYFSFLSFFPMVLYFEFIILN